MTLSGSPAATLIALKMQKYEIGPYISSMSTVVTAENNIMPKFARISGKIVHDPDFYVFF